MSQQSQKTDRKKRAFRIREEAVLSRFVDVIAESPDQASEFARGLDYVDFRVYDEEHWELDEIEE